MPALTRFRFGRPASWGTWIIVYIMLLGKGVSTKICPKDSARLRKRSPVSLTMDLEALAQSTLTSGGGEGIFKGATGNWTLGEGPPRFFFCPQKTAPLATWRTSQVFLPIFRLTFLTPISKVPLHCFPCNPKDCSLGRHRLVSSINQFI